MSISSSPEAATVETRASNTAPTTAHPTETPQPLVALLSRSLTRRHAARTLAASGLALGIGGATAIAAGAQETPQGPPPDWSGDDSSSDDTPTTTDDTSTDTDTDTDTDTTTDDTSDTTGTTTTTTGSGNGQAIADFALQYVGLPYVSAGRDPSTGFDCSGFTYYVIMNVLGIDIGGSPEGQVGYGSPVEYGAWEPGDLVFFANTFREGVSHVGIAIGGSQMVHAENESTGVTISDITSDYYTSHYFSAIRF
ncbi:MAG: C40 family peptidase [Thermomicrobiales bacterium]